MSGKATGRAWELDLPRNQQVVLLANADHADHDGENVRPSRALIAWKTGYSEDSVQRITKELRDRGVLVLVRPATPGYPPEYRIDFDAAPQKPPPRKGGQNDHPPSVKGGQGATSKGGQPCPPQRYLEPSIEKNARERARSLYENAGPAERAALKAIVAVADAKRLPDTWKPDSALAACERYADRDIEREAESFRHYYTDGAGENRKVKDVVARWRNWLDNAPTVAADRDRRTVRRRGRGGEAYEERLRRDLEAIAQLQGGNR